MFPTQQRLDGDGPVLPIDDRLVMQNELRAFVRAMQIVLEFELVDRLLVHRALVKAKGSRSDEFRARTRRIGDAN
jgi:hypothetical protein